MLPCALPRGRGPASGLAGCGSRAGLQAACRIRSAGVGAAGGGSRRQRLNTVQCTGAAVEAPAVEEADEPAPQELEGLEEPSLGPDVLNRSYYPKGVDTEKKGKLWYIIDAEGQILGRLATLVATYARGKHLPTFTPSMNMGAFVIVVNADKVVVSGKKYTDKKYWRHSNGRPGKWKEETFKNLQQRIPERIVEKAVKGMLPKNRLGREVFRQIKVYSGPGHPHQAQQPIDITNRINAKRADINLVVPQS
ncbi:unnamed protein product [Ostreobium quekettii]|uniref:Ribosomal protein L13 n=1 Tax=Ostreobium quekettii TaxID=121088 RepID=A0A8S1IMA1_9CHLO|nr:unnamed protein product [Ostreobium quekettii]|eukprot:evm.model.scf_94.10 EVM.evm.TU.scf_94.10   scf_94:80253-82430(-)